MNIIFVLLVTIFSPNCLGFVSTARYYNRLRQSRKSVEFIKQSLFSFLSKQWNDILTLDSTFQIFNETEEYLIKPSNLKCKTVIIETSNCNYYAVTLPRDSKVDFSKIQSLLKQDESQFKLVQQKEVEFITGYRIGSIPPMGFSRIIQSIFDFSLLNYQTVTVSTGILNISVIVDPNILSKHSKALLADIIVSNFVQNNEKVVITTSIMKETNSLVNCSVLPITPSSTSFFSESNLLSTINTTHNYFNNARDADKDAKVNANDQNTNWFLTHRNELPINVKDKTEKINLLHLVGVIATKRRISKQLVFLNIIPPHIDDNYFPSTYHSNNNEKQKANNYRNRLYAWNSFPFYKNEKNCIDPLLMKVVNEDSDSKSTTTISAITSEEGVAIQLLLGATIITRLGQENAYKIMKDIKIGQKVYVIGEPQRNPYDPNVLDIVTHSLRLLEEVEVPWVISEEERQDSLTNNNYNNNIYSSSSSGNDIMAENKSIFMTSSFTAIPHMGGEGEERELVVEEKGIIIDNAMNTTSYISLDEDILPNILLVNDIKSLQRMNNEIDTWLNDKEEEDYDDEEEVEVEEEVEEMGNMNYYNLNTAESNTIFNDKINNKEEEEGGGTLETVKIRVEEQNVEREDGSNVPTRNSIEENVIKSKYTMREINYIRKYGSPSRPNLMNSKVYNPVYRIIGFDCEWQPDSKMYRLENETSFMNTDMLQLNRSPVALLQIATRRNVYLLDLVELCQQTPGILPQSASTIASLSETESLLNASLGKIMSSSNVIKVGLSPNQDIKRLVWSYPQLTSLRQFNSILDIQPLAMKAFPKVSKKNLEGLSKLSLHIFGLPVNKTSQCSDWGIRPLTSEQIYYAALDAYILTRMFDSLFSLSSLAAGDSSKILDPLVSDYQIKFPLIGDSSNNNYYNRNTLKNYIDFIPTNNSNRISVKAVILNKLPSYLIW